MKLIVYGTLATIISLGGVKYWLKFRKEHKMLEEQYYNDKGFKVL